MPDLSVLILIAIMTLCALALMALEAFIPGVSFAGIAGAILIIADVSVCWSAFGVLPGIALLIISGTLSFLITRLVMHSMKHGRLSRSGLFMSDSIPPVVHSPGQSIDLEPNTVGMAKTALRPSGIAEFGSDRVHVTSESGFIDAGTEITVSRVEGAKILVTRARPY